MTTDTKKCGNDLNVPDLENKERVIVIGGGFGGLTTIKHLNKKKFQIVMIDQHNYHTFQPLLYQVATGALEADSIAYPLRKYVKSFGDLHFRMGKVKEIDTDKNLLITSMGKINFDYLIIATGSKTNYFGNKEMQENAMAMKTVPHALDLRSLILQNLELAILETDPVKRDALLHFVIVGGGPTGVELAGAIGDLKKYVFREEYHDLNIDNLQITLVEGSDRLLHVMSEKSSSNTHKFLKSLGINIFINSIISHYDGEKVIIGEDKIINTKNVIWTAGVKGNHPEGLNEDFFVPGNRIKVNEYCQLTEHPNIYAIGDIAAMITDDFPRGHPMVAPTAIQMGAFAAKMLNHYRNTDKKPSAFKYKNKGSMATIGRNKAVAELGSLRFKGFFAWLAWLFVHLMSIVGFRNRMIVFINWSLSYLTFNSALRLIIRPFSKEEDEIRLHPKSKEKPQPPDLKSQDKN
ncbi:MAG: NAD(P)/FAD-dependent oxidoreductase [Bacteroidales bacterium]